MNIPPISLIELSRTNTKATARRFDCVSYTLVLIVVKQAAEGWLPYLESVNIILLALYLMGSPIVLKVLE